MKFYVYFEDDNKERLPFCTVDSNGVIKEDDTLIRDFSLVKDFTEVLNHILLKSLLVKIRK